MECRYRRRLSRAPLSRSTSISKRLPWAMPPCKPCLTCFPLKSKTSRKSNTMNVNQIMKQAQQMQERLQKQMAEMRVEASSGGGMVTVVVNGNKQIQSLKIDPEVVSKDDVDMLQDLVLAAVNDAQRKADEELSKTMGGMMGGMKIPGMS